MPPVGRWYLFNAHFYLGGWLLPGISYPGSGFSLLRQRSLVCQCLGDLWSYFLSERKWRNHTRSSQQRTPPAFCALLGCVCALKLSGLIFHHYQFHFCGCSNPLFPDVQAHTVQRTALLVLPIIKGSVREQGLPFPDSRIPLLYWPTFIFHISVLHYLYALRTVCLSLAKNFIPISNDFIGDTWHL